MSSEMKLATAPDKPRWYIRAANRVLSKVGARLTSSNRRLNLFDAMRQLKSQGIEPKTLVDVGVAWGTQDLYEAYPEAQLLLVEPNQQWRDACESILRRRPGKAFYVGAGESEGSMTLHVWRGAEGSSSYLREAIATTAEVVEVSTPIRRLDQIVAEAGLPGPYLVKIDVQGAELDVLRGMGGIDAQTVAVVVETSLFTGDEKTEFHALASLLQGKGFRLYDLVGFNYRPRDGSLACVDAVFVRHDGPARRTLEWD